MQQFQGGLAYLEELLEQEKPVINGDGSLLDLRKEIILLSD